MAKFKQILILAAIAAVATASTSQTFSDKVDEIDAQIQLLDKQKQLQDALQRSAGGGMGDLPRIVSISGVDGALTSRVLYSTGRVATVAEGAQIASGVKVVAMTSNAVMVQIGTGKKTKVVPLDFMVGAQTAGMPGVPGVPGMPPAITPGVPMPLPPELLPAPPSVGVTAPVRPAIAPMAAPSAGAPVAVAAPGAAPAQMPVQVAPRP